MERDSLRVFQSRTLCFCLSKGSEGNVSARGANAVLVPQAVSAARKGFAADISVSRHFCEQTQEEKSPKVRGCDLETQNCFPSWCLGWNRAQVLCKAGLGFTWQSTLLSAPWKGMTWPEGHWRE